MKYLIFALIFCASCMNTGNTNKNTIIEEKSDSIKKQTKLTIDKNEIQGTWADYETKREVYQIKGDTIYYFDHPDRLKYKITNDTFIIFYEDTLEKYKILELDKDSFINKSRLNYINHFYKTKY